VAKLALLGPKSNLLCTALVTFWGCVLVAVILHEPIPRIHDEFSYALMGDTFAHGHMANPAPPLPEFFETFHVLVRPVYASKYFPAQGLFLALGQKLTGHPAVGVWLSSALACAAAVWMLEAWIGPGWALFGGLLLVLQNGIYSYWSQTFWGGMVAALGGALAFGAVRRLWDEFSWTNSVWLALGIVILVNSRPAEGLLALLPITGFFLAHLWRKGQWRQRRFWSSLVLPAMFVLAVGAFLTCSYNRAITGSLWKPPHLLHGEQYEASPEFSFLPLRPKPDYSSPWLRYYYEVQQMNLYQGKRHLTSLISWYVPMFTSWWEYYCGVLLTLPLVIPGLLRKGPVRYLQATVLLAFVVFWSGAGPKSAVLLALFDLLVFSQIALLWVVFDSFWPRLAVVTSALVLFEALFVKWFYQHYFAPAACLVLYLQVEGLRRLWNWRPQSAPERLVPKRSGRRRPSPKSWPGERLRPWLRGLVYALPVFCALSLVLKVETRLQGWKQGIHDPDQVTLALRDWSLQRAALEGWLQRQPSPQLVFVRYLPSHDVNSEWVYNHADIVHSQVIWARDLGAEHNRLLLRQFPERSVWLLQADWLRPQLIPYSQVDPQAPQPVPGKPDLPVEQDQLNW
jgi:hypothetical protein